MLAVLRDGVFEPGLVLAEAVCQERSLGPDAVAGGAEKRRCSGVRTEGHHRAGVGHVREGARPKRKQRCRFRCTETRVRLHDLDLEVHHLLEQVQVAAEQELGLAEGVLHRRLSSGRPRWQRVPVRERGQRRLDPRLNSTLGHDATPIKGSNRGTQFSTLVLPAGGETSFSTLPFGGVFANKSGRKMLASISSPSTTRGPGRLK